MILLENLYSGEISKMDNTFKITFICLMDGDLVMNPEHVGVGYLLAVLRKEGYECNVLELSRDNHEEVLDKIKTFNPQLVGFSLMSVNKKHAAEFGRKIKERFANIHVCCGGPIATYGADKLLKSESGDYIDSAVIGEAEETIIQLVRALESNESLKGILGVCYRDQHGIHVNPRRGPVHELDDLPFPARDQFENAGGNLEYIRISTSRGCTSRCTFCSAPNVTNRYTKGMKVWRGRSSHCVVNEIKHLVDKYNFNTFDFVDSTYEDPGHIGKKRIKEIAEGILDNDLRIYYNCCMQAMNWKDEDRELLSLLAKSGLEKVLVGIESGSDIGLKHWDKRSDTEDNRRVIRLLREQNIYVAFGFIMFHPHSTLAELRDNTQFLRENLGHNLRRFGTRLEIYPGTVIEGVLRQEGLLHSSYEDTLDCLAYDYIDEDIKMFANAFASMFGEDYEKDLVIKQEPPVFEFETFDIVIHTYLSRLFRFYREDSMAVEILEDFKGYIGKVYKELTEFNFQLMNKGLDLLESGEFTKEYFSSKSVYVNQLYKEKMEEIKRKQLITSRKLMKMGYDISIINSKKHKKKIGLKG